MIAIQSAIVTKNVAKKDSSPSVVFTIYLSPSQRTGTLIVIFKTNEYRCNELMIPISQLIELFLTIFLLNHVIIFHGVIIYRIHNHNTYSFSNCIYSIQ